MSDDNTARQLVANIDIVQMPEVMVRDDGTMPYWASTKDCRNCPLKFRCTKGAKRIVTRSIYEEEREKVRAMKATAEFARSADERKKVEMRFAHRKRHLGFRRLRLRGLTGASDEFLLVAAAQNVKKLITRSNRQLHKWAASPT